MIYDHPIAITTRRVFARLPGFAPGFETYVKLEGLNPAGSIKLKTARELLAAARQSEAVGTGFELIESTSGNLGVALAGLCAAWEHRITLVTDPNANARSIRLMEALGATVVVVRERDQHGGYLQTRIDYIQRRLAEEPNLHWLRTPNRMIIW